MAGKRLAAILLPNMPLVIKSVTMAKNMSDVVQIEDYIRSHPDLDDQVKESIVHDLRSMTEHVWDDEMIAKMLKRFEAADHREPNATKSDIDLLRKEIDLAIDLLRKEIDLAIANVKLEFAERMSRVETNLRTWIISVGAVAAALANLDGITTLLGGG